MALGKLFLNLTDLLSYTKMGYAGGTEPQFIIPSIAATVASNRVRGTMSSLQRASDELNVLISDEAVAACKGGSHHLQNPIRHGQIENWDLMETYWAQSFFKYLRCDPEEHAVLLTEPPLNAPENREYTAEIMFESFNVPALYIGVQAVLALAASWMDVRAKGVSNPLTGTVVDSGDGVTHVIPVVEGYAIGSAIRHVPIAGKEVTMFLQQLLRDRGNTGIAPEDSMAIARKIKEDHCYVCSDPAREFLRYDSDAAMKTQFNNGKYSFELGHERFLAAEVFFNPEMISSASTAANVGISLPSLVDDVIQACPIDCRRSLYGNIVLSGGSTMFRDFGKRLQKELRTAVDERLAYTMDLKAVNKSELPTVNVVAHHHQRYAVWTGGSLLASMDQFGDYCLTKEQYEEHGPSICRQSRVFTLA